MKVIEAAGGQPHQLTSGVFSSTAPNWSRDRKWLYFGSDRTGRFEIWRIPAQGGAAEQITRDGGYIAVESTDARTLYYTKTAATGPLYELSLGSRDVSAPRKFEIRFHDFAAGRSILVTVIEEQVAIGGLAVSGDRKSFLFTYGASAGNDLMLIENFR